MSAPGTAEQRLRVTVIHSPGPRRTVSVELLLAPTATVGDALDACGLTGGRAGDTQQQAVGVWGRKAALDQPLRDLDRVELYRELQVDPKLARRERFKRQGARQAGLFAQRRPGAKQGY